MEKILLEKPTADFLKMKVKLKIVTGAVGNNFLFLFYLTVQEKLESHWLIFRNLG